MSEARSCRRYGQRTPLPCAVLALLSICGALAAPPEELLTTKGTPGRYGGGLIVAERSQVKTLNPVTAIDAVSRQVIQLITADLVHIDRKTYRTEPALARVVDVSPDRRRYVLQLRRGIRFSDGHPFDADDVLFTFQVYLDEKIGSPQRDLLIVGGKPVAVHKKDAYTVTFEFAQPYAPGDRLFDSIAILPRHLLLKSYLEGKLANAWSLSSAASEIAGLGPFQFKEYIPGQRVVLERNPHYWKQDRSGNRLPYLQNIVFEFVGSEDAQVLRFRSGEADVISRLSARNFEVLSRQDDPAIKLEDLGAGMEYSFLFFNLNDVSRRNLPQVRARQVWFSDVRFRRAVSAALDRESMARLIYAGRATPIWTHVTPGNKLWIDTSVSRPPRSLETARALLGAAGFSRKENGSLVDRAGRTVEFSIIINTGNNERAQIATIVQNDLAQLGMSVHVVSLEFRSMLDRVTNTFDYDACVLGLVSGDVDPGSEMNVWLSSGSAHFWNLGQTRPGSPWESELDELMMAQMVARVSAVRKRLYDRVQQIVAGDLPIICLVSPNVLVGAKSALENFRPAILPPHTLWNAEELFWRRR